jgi:hypothetical protein
VRQFLQTLVHKHAQRSTAPPPVARPRAPARLQAPVDAGPTPVTRLGEHVLAARAPAGERQSSGDFAPRPTAGVLRDLRRIERLVVRRERERTRVERIHPSAKATSVTRPGTAAVARPATVASPQPPLPRPAAARAPAVHAAPESAAGTPRTAAAEDVAPRAAAAPGAPDVDEIAERVIRLIERRARAQRERLGLI